MKTPEELTKRAIQCFLFLFSPLLLGCKTCWMESDKAERQRIFKECMESLPDGPQTTHYNDWSEVVDSCDDAAYYQSKIKKCAD